MNRQTFITSLLALPAIVTGWVKSAPDEQPISIKGVEYDSKTDEIKTPIDIDHGWLVDNWMEFENAELYMSVDSSEIKFKAVPVTAEMENRLMRLFHNQETVHVVGYRKKQPEMHFNGFVSDLVVNFEMSGEQHVTFTIHERSYRVTPEYIYQIAQDGKSQIPSR